jgi:hypothetical protein
MQISKEYGAYVGKHSVSYASFVFRTKSGEEVYRQLQDFVVVEIAEPLYSATLHLVSGEDEVPAYRHYTGLQAITKEDGSLETLSDATLSHLIVKCLDEYAKRTFKEDGLEFVCTEEWYSLDD